jgi:hypothetical protein
MKHVETALFVAVLAAPLASGQTIRTLIADFGISGSVRLVDADGADVAGESASLNMLAKDPRRLSPFGDLHYEGKTLRATLIVNSDTIKGDIENKGASTVYIRFDQAVVSSNVHAAELPLKVYSATVQGVHMRHPGQLASVPAMRLAPGQKGHVYLAPSYAGLFPAGRLFGVEFDGKEAALSKDGIGNAARLRVPVEVDGKRLSAVIDMKAEQSSVRSSYR